MKTAKVKFSVEDGFETGDCVDCPLYAKTAQFTTKSNWLWSILDRCEVIGNIHENYELMDKKKWR